MNTHIFFAIKDVNYYSNCMRKFQGYNLYHSMFAFLKKFRLLPTERIMRACPDNNIIMR